MSIFSGFKDNLKKSEAAVVVQNLLEIQEKNGIFSGDASKTANDMVASVWDQKPHFFNGQGRPRPHKVTIAAIALAIFVKDHSHDHRHRDAALLSLGTVLSQIERNPSSYSFSYVDQGLLNSAAGLFVKFGEE